MTPTSTQVARPGFSRCRFLRPQTLLCRRVVTRAYGTKHRAADRSSTRIVACLHLGTHPSRTHEWPMRPTGRRHTNHMGARRGGTDICWSVPCVSFRARACRGALPSSSGCQAAVEPTVVALYYSSRRRSSACLVFLCRGHRAQGGRGCRGHGPPQISNIACGLVRHAARD